MSFGSVIVMAFGFRSPMPLADPERPSGASNASASASRATRDENSRDMIPPPCRDAGPKPALLVMPRVDVVLRADELDQLVVGHQPLRDLDGPRARVGLWIVDGDRDFERAERRAPEALRRPAGRRD